VLGHPIVDGACLELEPVLELCAQLGPRRRQVATLVGVRGEIEDLGPGGMARVPDQLRAGSPQREDRRSPEVGREEVLVEEGVAPGDGLAGQQRRPASALHLVRDRLPGERQQARREVDVEHELVERAPAQGVTQPRVVDE
jgi:hypothetical protein